VAAEAPAGAILWVDRRAGRAVRVSSHRTLGALSSSLGTSVNIALAKGLRSKLVVGSDCGDPRLIRLIAKAVGLRRLAQEEGVSLLQIKSEGLMEDATSAAQALKEVLSPGASAFLLLEGRHRAAASRQALVDALSASSVRVHCLNYFGLDNYLIDAELIARVSGAAPEVVAVKIREACERMRAKCRLSFVAAQVASVHGSRSVDIVTNAESQFDIMWETVSGRTSLVNGRMVVTELNQWLEPQGYRLIDASQLASATKVQSLSQDLLQPLLKIEELLSQ